MKCTKCQGLIVETYVMESDRYGYHHLPAYHCVNCGKHWFPPVSSAEAKHVAEGSRMQDIGTELNITRQGADYLYHKALNKLRACTRDLCLGDIVDHDRPKIAKSGGVYKQWDNKGDLSS